MASKNICGRLIWFEDQAKLKRYPNATLLSRRFETSVTTAQQDIEHQSPRHPGQTNRVADPSHLLNSMGTWHLIAFCGLRNDLRDFNLTKSRPRRCRTAPSRPGHRSSSRSFSVRPSASTRAARVQEVTLARAIAQGRPSP
ncbi:MAG: hypothetical protein OHK006_11000 [Thermodesulfovibrionales bacterium]